MGVAYPKYCSKCEKLKPASEFYAKYTRCKVCAKADDRARYAANRGKYAERNKQQTLKHKYGLTVEAYTAMLQVQFYKCAACGDKLDPEAICVDHDHATDEVRELLCRHCNTALGYVKDDITRLEKLVIYLRRHGK
jgi:DNA-directed RNA polymerase subunit RPC12/RpoP